MLRETYRNSKAVDPIDRCQDAGLLVLDEAGLSGGDVMNCPCSTKFLITDMESESRQSSAESQLVGNGQQLGERLADRFKESAFRVITLAGTSHRSKVRNRYFDTT